MTDPKQVEEERFPAALREALKGNSRPASLELIANVYADISNIRDALMAILPFMINLAKTSEDVKALEDFAGTVYKFQNNIGKGMNRLIAEAQAVKDD